MAYILKRRRPTAKQSYNTFKAVTRIAELANGDRDAAENLLGKMYLKAMTVAASSPGRMVSVFPPDGSGLWSWNRSFDIACEVAGQITQAEIPIAVPEEANIFIGKEIMDMDEEDAADALDALIFDFGEEADDEDGTGRSDNLDTLADRGETQPRWLDDFDDNSEFADMMRRNSLVDVEKSHETSKDKNEWEQEAEDVERIVNGTSQNTFAEFLQRKMSEHGLDARELTKRANIMSSTLAKLRNSENPVPTKSQILAIGFALELEREEFEHLLMLTGYCLSECVTRDRIVSYYLDHGIYSLAQINRALFVHDIPTLGTHAPVAK